MARGMENLVFVLVLVLVVAAAAAAESVVEGHHRQHHVVGGDRGWDIASDLHSWSSNRLFFVGDNIWFTYSAAQESILELRSKEEFESCDINNPIKMYTDGINAVGLQGEGARYFVSSKQDRCKNGLKLHVQVVPKPTPNFHEAQALAAGPTTPSASLRLSGPATCVVASFAAAALVFLLVEFQDPAPHSV